MEKQKSKNSGYLELAWVTANSYMFSFGGDKSVLKLDCGD